MSEASPAPLAVAGPNRRRAFRVETRLPIRHRRLNAEERAAHERELSVPIPAAVPADPAVAAWLLRLDAKLDRLATQLGILEDRPLGDADVRDVDLSSVGVRLVSAAALDEGDDVLVECMVPGTEPRPVRALARVARVEPRPPSGPGPRRVALEFSRIPESDRDALVRFTQDVQRCAIV